MPSSAGPGVQDDEPSKQQRRLDKMMDENAIDDSEDVDEDFANLQKTISNTRKQQSKPLDDERAAHVLGFPFLPLIRPLTISDLESCVALENAAFHNPAHRCSPEKFDYRLTSCPELCMGLFCTVSKENAKSLDTLCIDTLKTARPVETGRDDGAVSVLFAHIVSTRSNSEVVTDNDMDWPRDFRTSRPNKSGLGHQEGGRTITLHSLAVHPKLQGCGLGKLIMKAYIQQIRMSDTADRISLICQDHLINYYLKHGFKDKGPSVATFGGGGWRDMVLQLSSPKKDGPPKNDSSTKKSGPAKK